MAIDELPDDSGRELSDNDEMDESKDTTTSNSGPLAKFEKLLKESTSEDHCLMLQRLKMLLDIDIIASLYDDGVYIPIQHVIRYLDAITLCRMELVCKKWAEILKGVNAWRELIRSKIYSDSHWKQIGEARNWLKYLEDNNVSNLVDPKNFKTLYVNATIDVRTLKNNWENGNYTVDVLHCRSKQTNGVYCIQYDNKKIVAGLRDNTARIWDIETKQCITTFVGHTGSVLCLQYDDECLVTGSSDSSVRIWSLDHEKCIKVLNEHSSAVLSLKFKNYRLVTCSKDWFIKVWNFEDFTNPTMVKTLSYHRGAINAIDFDEKYILSASGDRTLVVWNAGTLDMVHVFTGHQRGIASLHYEYPIIATGSSDFCIRMWNVEKKTCIQIVHGNEECLRFNKEYLVSGAYDGVIRIWDMKTLFTFSTHNSSDHRYNVLRKHEGRVFKVLFDHLKLVSSSHDDTIVFWNFLDDKYASKAYWNAFEIIPITIENSN